MYLATIKIVANSPCLNIFSDDLIVGKYLATILATIKSSVNVVTRSFFSFWNRQLATNLSSLITAGKNPASISDDKVVAKCCDEKFFSLWNRVLATTLSSLIHAGIFPAPISDEKVVAKTLCEWYLATILSSLIIIIIIFFFVVNYLFFTVFWLWNSKMKNQIKTKLYYPNQQLYKIRLRTFSVIEKYVNNKYTKQLINH